MRLFAYMSIYPMHSCIPVGGLAQPFPVQGYTAYKGVSGDVFMVLCE